MDDARFDTLVRAIARSASRRTALRLLATAVVGGLSGGLLEHRTAAHDLSKTCKKKSAKAKKKCLKKAKKHNATHATVPPSTPVLTPVLTYQCPELKDFTISAGARIVQSFTALNSGSLHQIQFGIRKQAGSTGDYVVELLDLGIDGKPTNTVLATATIPDASVPEGHSTLTASFAGPPLVAGTEYAAALSRSGALFFIHTRDDDGCAGRVFEHNPSTGQYAEQSLVYDLVVTVTVLV
jgi:hypothetical protein